MRTWKKAALGATGGFAAWYLIGEAYHESQKASVFGEARAKADELNKPLLNLGCSNWYGYTLLGPSAANVRCVRNEAIRTSEINADVVPRNVPRFLLIDRHSPYRIPLPDRSVVTFCSHVIEHAEDPDEVMREVERVSVESYVITPAACFPQTLLHPEHKWLFVGGARYRIPWSGITNAFKEEGQMGVGEKCRFRFL